MRRVRLGPDLLERLANRAGVVLPRLPPVHSGGAREDPDTGLRRLGLLDDADGLFPELPRALGVLAQPETMVDIDVAIIVSAGRLRRLRSYHRRAGGRVAAIATTGGDIELAWGDDGDWQAELARTVTIPTFSEPLPDRPPPLDLDLPHELVLGSGAALRERRPDVLRELAVRHGADPDIVRRLHTATRGRMRTVVTSCRATGWVEWVAYDDGWRALTPSLDDGLPMITLHQASPDLLGVAVAALVARVAA